MHKADLILLLKKSGQEETWMWGQIFNCPKAMTEQDQNSKVAFPVFVSHSPDRISLNCGQNNHQTHAMSKQSFVTRGIFFFLTFSLLESIFAQKFVWLILEERVNSHFCSICREKPPRILKTSLFWVLKTATISMQYLTFYTYGNITFINWLDNHTSPIK